MRTLPCRSLLLALALLPGAVPAVAQVSPGPLAEPHRDLDTSLGCFSCHGTSKEEMDDRCLACHEEVAWLRDRDRGFHGQPGGRKPCASCHPDHGGRQFELTAWPGGAQARFDHAMAGWPLRGRHAAAACEACHQPRLRRSQAARIGPPASGRQRWTGLDPACASCHEDAHRGALGGDCGSCHGEDRWKPAAAFDHAKTAFPLAGRHATVACAACHQAAHLKLAHDAQGRPVPLYKPLPHRECSACHRDVHEARLGPDCSRCHVADDFRRVTKEAFDHDRTRYPLRGAHRSVRCASCHDAGPAKGKKPAFGRCGDCHADAHARSATVGGRPADCAACHDVAGWSPSTFTAAMHASSAYPLTGAHQRVACASCHSRTKAAGLGTAGVLIRAPHDRCMDCHRDAHGGQFAGRADRGACEACHRVEGWKPSTYGATEHAKIALPLDGGHARIACAACHGPDRPGLPPLPPVKEIGSARVALKLRETACEACHRDPHGGRYAGAAAPAGATGCSGCHDTVSFRSSTIDVAAHRRFAFPLEGAHRATPCVACHRELDPGPASSTLVGGPRGGRSLEFRQKRSRCADCHQDFHEGQLARRRDPQACEACHVVHRFAPASLFDHDRDAAFPLAGAHARVACAKCHPERTTASGALRIVYSPIPSRCEDCHAGTTAPRGPSASTGGASP